MALSLKTLAIRTLTGAVFVAIIVGSILYNQYSFAFVFAAFAAMASAEFYRLVEDLTHTPRGTLFVDILGSVLLFITFYIYADKNFHISGIITVPYLVYFLVRFIMQLYDKVERPLEGWAYSFLGQIYVALPFAMCNVLYFRFSPLILLSLFVFIWVNDTGAYLVGCTIGKHRLFERISPKKSWEGFWGGLILAAATAYVASLYLGILNTWQWIGLALVCSVFGTWGDLCESLIKRSLNVKDSGKILPGHGGWLDRFDSVLLAAPASILYLFIVFSIG